MGILSQKSEELYSVQMSISQAPSSFRQPVTQKKAFNPPFKVCSRSLVLAVINCRVNRCKYQPVWEMLDLKFLWRLTHIPWRKIVLYPFSNKSHTIDSLPFLRTPDCRIPAFISALRCHLVFLLIVLTCVRD